MACVVTALVACTSEMPVSNVSSCCTPRNFAWDAAELSIPLSPGVLPGFIVNGRVVIPVEKIVLPATDRIGGNSALLLNVAVTLSATFPAQPAFGRPLSCVVCHWFCWSECENKFCGRLLWLWYCCRVVGCTSVPTLLS